MYVKSPIFYMGGKYDLLNELLPRFPLEKDVDIFIDLFGGSGTVSINVPYKNVYYNELNKNIVDLLEMLKNETPNTLISHIENRIKEFSLPTTTTDLRYVEKEKRDKENENYLRFREFYNKQENKDLKDLYTLTFYSFCNCIRFNQKNEFNMPFGNRCLLDIHKTQIRDFYKNLNTKNMTILNLDAFDILKSITMKTEKLFIYLDPPYSNTLAIYNEQRAFGGWTIEHDYRLFNELDRISKLGVKWAMSNVLVNKGKENTHIKEWALRNKYKIIYIDDKTYSTFGTGNSNSQEVLIMNYDPPFDILRLFDIEEL